MEQLTLEQAANNYMPFATSEEDNRYIRSHQKSFKAGAEWQKEQDKQLLELLKAIAQWPGNLPDKILQAATGPNDAALRGGIICDMRDIAVEAIRRYEPDYTPFNH